MIRVVSREMNANESIYDVLDKAKRNLTCIDKQPTRTMSNTQEILKNFRQALDLF